MQEWLNRLAEFVIYNLLNLEEGVGYSETLLYFFPMVIQLTILFVVVIYIMSAINKYLSYEKIRIYLERHNKTGSGNILASMFGAVTPFCECSSVPLFVGMMQARIPLGIALSFLITSPLVNEMAIAFFWVTYGWQVTIIYVASGIVLGIAGGILLDKLGMSKYTAEWIQNLSHRQPAPAHTRKSLKEKIAEIHKAAFGTIRKLFPYITIGIAVGAFIRGYVPDAFFEETIATDNFMAVPLAVLLGIPMYIDAVSILPVIETLADKGVPLGTAIAFMMGSIGLSLPQVILLKKVMEKELVISFYITIGIGMMLSGYLFNLVFR